VSSACPTLKSFRDGVVCECFISSCDERCTLSARSRMSQGVRECQHDVRWNQIDLIWWLFTDPVRVAYFRSIWLSVARECSPTGWQLLPAIFKRHFLCFFTICTNARNTNSIQFSSFCIAHYHKLEICLRGLYNLYTYDIPDLWPQFGSEKNSQEIEKNLSQGKKEETFRRSTEEDPSLQDGQVQ